MNHNLLEQARIDRRNLFNLPRLLKGMADQNLDAVIAVSPINVTYTGGVNWADREQSLGFVVTTISGTQGVVINEADYYHFKAVSWIKDIRLIRYSKTETGMKEAAVILLGEMLRELGLSNARIGIETSYMPVANYMVLTKHMPEARLVDGEAAFEYARLIKTPAEIELFRLAAYLTDKAIGTAFAQTRPGDSEKEIAALMQANILWAGADVLTNNAETNAGPRGAHVHTWPRDVAVLLGEVVHSDFGGQFGGYRTDMSRMAVLGQANARQEYIYRHLWEVQQRVMEEIRPGVVVGDLWEISELGFAVAGFPHAWGTIGHSTGLGTHEGFHISKGSNAVIQAGMLINVEPSRVEPELGRFTIEDGMLVTENGIERLTTFMNTERMFVIR